MSQDEEQDRWCATCGHAWGQHKIIMGRYPCRVKMCPCKHYDPYLEEEQYDKHMAWGSPTPHESML